MIQQRRMATVVLLACTAYLLGSLGALSPERVEAGPDDPEAVRLTDVVERLARIEDALQDLVRAQEEQAKRLEPVVWMAEELRAYQAQTGGKSPLFRARLAANETAAIATLRNIVSAQAQVQQSGKIDMDNDGNGEYAGFLEMSSASKGRMYHLLFPPVLTGAFRVMSKAGTVSRSGYFFRIFLPDADGQGVGEPQRGYGKESPVAPDLAEQVWCCYAWPIEQGESGKRAFFTNQRGDVLACDTHRYSAQDGGPAADAAFRERGDIRGAAGGGKGADENTWMAID